MDLVFNYPRRTELERLGIKMRAIRRRIDSPRVPAEEKERARVRLEKTMQEIDLLQRERQNALVTAGT